MNELTTGIQQLSAQWYDHTDATRLAEVIRLSVAAQELEQRQAVQEPDWYHAECMDPDRSGFFVDKADAEARVSDQGGTVTALYTAAPQPAQVPDAKDAEIAALKEKLAAKDTEVAFLHSVRRDEQAMSESYTRPDTHSTFLLRRALKQLDRWAEKYGQWQPAWLPPGGDVTLAEDIDAHLGQAGQMPAAYLPLPANPQPIEQAPYRQGDPSFAALAVQPDYKR